MGIADLCRMIGSDRVGIRSFEKKSVGLERSMAVRSILYLQPKPGARQHLIDAFRRLDVFGHAMRQPGCISIEMLAPAGENAALAVIALWTGREGIEGWINNPWRAESSRELDQFVEEGPDSAIYEIVMATAPELVSIEGEEAPR
jgi:heme-degrading monooxygenase HmoA